MKTYLAPKFLIRRDPERCIQCQVCVNQCTFDTHYYFGYDAKEILEHRFIRLFPLGFDPTAGFMPTNVGGD